MNEPELLGLARCFEHESLDAETPNESFDELDQESKRRLARANYYYGKVCEKGFGEVEEPLEHYYRAMELDLSDQTSIIAAGHLLFRTNWPQFERLMLQNIERVERAYGLEHAISLRLFLAEAYFRTNPYNSWVMTLLAQ